MIAFSGPTADILYCSKNRFLTKLNFVTIAGDPLEFGGESSIGLVTSWGAKEKQVKTRCRGDEERVHWGRVVFKLPSALAGI